MPNSCILCGHVKEKHQEKKVSFFRFPADRSKRGEWLKAVRLKEEDIEDHSRLCSQHFLNGDPKHIPSIALGSRFASPKKILRKRSTSRSISPRPTASKRLALTKSSSPTQCTPTCSSGEVSDSRSDVDSLRVSVGEQLFTNYEVHELPGTSGTSESQTSFSFSEKEVINRALLARIEYLESENQKLKEAVGTQRTKHFRLEDVMHDDRLIRFYTGFPSYEYFLLFFSS